MHFLRFGLQRNLRAGALLSGTVESRKAIETDYRLGYNWTLVIQVRFLIDWPSAGCASRPAICQKGAEIIERDRLEAEQGQGIRWT